MPAHRRNRSRAMLVVLVIAAALWGLAVTGTKYALRGFAPISLLTVELVAATIALWVVLLVRGYRPPGSWGRVVMLGILEPAAAYLAETVGLDRTSAANGAVLVGLESVFVVFLAFTCLGEAVTAPIGLAVLVALAGLVVLEGGSSSTGFGVGDVLVLCGAFSAAGYTILARGLEEDADSLSLTAHQFAIATLALLPVAIATWADGGEPLPTHVPARYWLVAALVGVAGFGLSFLLYNRAIAVVAAGPAAVIINLIPAFGFVSAVVLLGEAVTFVRLAGATLIIGSVLLFAWAQWSRERTAQLTMMSELSRSSSELVPT